jgi:hypothetical protein
LKGIEPDPKSGPTPFYEPIDLGHGLLEVDDETMDAVRSGLE